MSDERQKYIDAAQKYVERKQFDKAVIEYQRALRDDPSDVRVLLKIGDLQVRSDNRSAAADTYSQVAATYDQKGFFLKSVAVYKQILQIDPSRIDVFFKLAEANLKLGLVSDAMQNLEALAQRFAQSGQDNNLLDVYRRMLAADPTNVATHIRRAELLSRMGQSSEAAKGFEHGCTLLETAGRIDDWSRVAERLFFHRPDDIPLALRLARYYLDRNDTRHALPKLQVAYKANAHDIAVLELLATAFRAIGQLPKTVSVLKEIAKIQADAGSSQKSAETYKRVLELAPTDSEALDALRAEVKTGRRPLSVPPDPLVPSVAANAVEPTHGSVSGTTFDEDELEEIIVDDNDVVFDLKATVPPAEGDSVEDTYIPPVPVAPAPVRGPLHTSHGLVIPPPVTVAQTPAAEARRLVADTEVLLKYGMRGTAPEQLFKAAQLDPKNPALRARIRSVCEAMNDPEGVLRETLALADLALETNHETALTEVLRALDIDPSNGHALHLHAELTGTITDSNYDGREVPEDFDLGAEDVPQPESEIYARAAVSPEDYNQGYSQSVSGDPYAAHSFTNWRQEEPYVPVASRPPQPVEDLGDVWGNAPIMESSRQIEEGLDEAEFFVTQCLYDDARDTLAGLLQIYPDHPLVLERWAEVDQLSRLQGSEDDAPGAYGIAAGLDEAVDDLGTLGNQDLLDGHEQLQGMHLVTEHALTAEDCDTHYDLGIAYKEMGLLDDAIAEFKIATMSPSRQCIGEMMIGLCYVEKSEIPLAIEHFRRGLQAPQRNEYEELGLYYEIGNAYELLGDPGEALYYYQKVDKHDPRFRDVSQKLSALQGYTPSAPQLVSGSDTDDFDQAFDDLVKD